MQLRQYEKQVGRYYCVPCVKFTSPNHKDVTLVGGPHFAWLPFYRRLQAVLDAAEEQGAVVTHEGRDWSNVLSEGFPPFTAEQYRELWPLYIVSKKVLARHNFGRQAQHIAPRRTWIFTDSFHEDTVTEVYSHRSTKPIARDFKSSINNPRKYIMKFLSAYESLATTKMKDVVRPPFTEERELEAAEAILDLTKNTPVISCWGQGHLPGIARHLERDGFEITTIEWLPFFPVTF